MRFNCGLTAAEIFDAKQDWHSWFAWYPVRINSGCVWLETVERKGTPIPEWEGGVYWDYVYRLIKT
jgi:hypothetical protein